MNRFEHFNKLVWGNINCPKIRQHILLQESTGPMSEAWARADKAKLKPEQAISDEQVKAYLSAKHGPNYQHLNKI